MQTKIVKDQIEDTLDALIEQTQIVLSHKGSIPQIEIDIVLENIRRLYVNYTCLNKLNSSVEDIEITKNVNDIISDEINLKTSNINTTELEDTYKPEIPDPIIEEPSKPTIEEVEKPAEITEEIVEYIDDNINSSMVSETQTDIIIEKEEPIIEQTNIIDNNENELFNDNQNQQNTNLFSEVEPTIIADKFKDDKKTLNETIISNKHDKSIVSKMQQTAINDLVKSIGVNDKFLFVRVLFNNDINEYNETINLLNNFASINQAFDYLDILKNRNNWDESSDASLKLFDLIRRKFQN